MTRSIFRTLPLLAVVGVLLASLGCGDSTPKTADVAVLRVANGISESKPVAIWEALPDSYQKDVHELVHGAIGKVDAELWNMTFDTVKKAVKVLRDKKSFIITNEMLAQMTDKAEFEKQYDQLVGLLDTIANSELSTHDQAKSINLGAFLDRTGSKVMADIIQAMKLVQEPEAKQAVKQIEKLKQVKAVIKEDKGETATVEITMPDEKPKVIEFVRIEGKWLPKDLTEQWKPMIEQGREGLKELTPEAMKKAKAAAMPAFDAINGLLGRLEKANTKEEFEEHLSGFMETIGKNF